MRRRTVLGAAVAGISLPAFASPVLSATTPLIDCHTHFYDPRRPEGIPWPAKDSSLYRPVLPEHLREQKQYRPLTGTVVVEASPRVEDNDWLLQLAAGDRFLVGIIGRLSSGMVPLSGEFREQVQKYSRNPLFRGIRIGSGALRDMLDRSDFAALQLLAEHNLVLEVNGGPDTPGLIGAVAGRVPTLRWVLNHIGNIRITREPPPPDWCEGIAAAGRHPNVYCKISALVEGAARDGERAPDDVAFYRPYTDVVWNAFTEERVIYGSNWPVSERAGDYFTVQRLAMEDAASRSTTALARFCHTNAQTVYAWPER